MANKGTPQGGVLSPLLWTLVVNGLLTELKCDAAKIVVYADDVAVIVTGKYLDTVSSIMEATLRKIKQWADRVGLGVNPEKTDLVLFTRKTRLGPWTTPRLGGTNLVLKYHTKYLGVILDSKLTWKLNVEERVRKATNALYACKGMLGKTWGLSPNLTHWVYTAVTRPILLYGILVWWTALRKQVYCKRLESVQRLVELCITGALRSTPTGALDVILGLKPINLVAEGTAKKTAIRLANSGLFAFRPYGHSTIIRESDCSSDYMVPKLEFLRKPDITIREYGWLSGLRPDTRTFNFFTDGSKMEGGVGAAVYCRELGIRNSYKLPDDCSVFQAEILAAKMASDLALSSGTENSQVNLFIDSQAAIKAISADQTYSSIVQACRESLGRLCTGRKVHIYWVRGHIGVEGNEVADELAKQGVLMPINLAESVRAPLQFFKRTIDVDISERAAAMWNSTTSCRVSRLMWRSYDLKATRYLLSLNRGDCRLLVSLITGHCWTAVLAKRAGLLASDDCRFCGVPGDRETVEHILCDCPGLSRSRANCLGAYSFRHLGELSEVGKSRLLAFAKRVWSTLGFITSD